MEKKLTKPEAEYEEEAMDDEMCAGCEHFIISVDLDTEVGACTKVEGDISSEGWCKLFEALSPIEGEEEGGEA